MVESHEVAEIRGASRTREIYAVRQDEDGGGEISHFGARVGNGEGSHGHVNLLVYEYGCGGKKNKRVKAEGIRLHYDRSLGFSPLLLRWSLWRAMEDRKCNIKPGELKLFTGKRSKRRITRYEK